MDQPFLTSSEWLCRSTSEHHFWHDQYVRPGRVPEFIHTPQVETRPPVDLVLLSASLLFSGPTPQSSDGSMSSSLGQASLGVFDHFKEADNALVHPGLSPLDQSSGCSSITDSHIPMHECTSLSEPYFTSTFVGSPKTFGPRSHFATESNPFCEELFTTDPYQISSITSSSCERQARERLYQFTAPEVSGRKPRPALEAPETLTSRASTSGSESPIVCLTCQRKFACKSSLFRHRKESCGNQGENRPFQCNQALHYGCAQMFKRRCGLKSHYMKLKLTEEQAVEKVRNSTPRACTVVGLSF